MSQDNILKKEFQKQDVERLRNLVQGKYGEKTRSSVGFSKKSEFHKEGDIWGSDGRTWTIKNGIKQNITKLDKAKKAYSMPLLCPSCKNVMKKRIDKQFYNIHKTCFDCVVDFEAELKKQGKWEKYQKDIKNNELDNKIIEFKAWVKDKMSESNNSFISEAGDVEKWDGNINKDLVDKNIKEVVEYLEGLKT